MSLSPYPLPYAVNPVYEILLPTPILVPYVDDVVCTRLFVVPDQVMVGAQKQGIFIQLGNAFEIGKIFNIVTGYACNGIAIVVPYFESLPIGYHPNLVFILQ